MMRQFLAVFGGEIAAFVIAYSVMPSSLIEYVAALNVTIVGIHFFPLARVFRVPRYDALGALFCGAGIVTAVAIAAGAARGDVPFILPGLLIPPGTWLVAASNLREAHALARAVDVADMASGGAAATEQSVRLSA
jgi:hypothetical protein